MRNDKKKKSKRLTGTRSMGPGPGLGPPRPCTQQSRSQFVFDLHFSLGFCFRDPTSRNMKKSSGLTKVSDQLPAWKPVEWDNSIPETEIPPEQVLPQVKRIVPVIRQQKWVFDPKRIKKGYHSRKWPRVEPTMQNNTCSAGSNAKAGAHPKPGESASRH